jgi:apolipoprotein N-acyltransferase
MTVTDISFPAFLKRTGINLLLLISASLLFALAFPNVLNRWGFGFIGYIAIVPVFPLIRRMKFYESFFYGILYGALSYALFNFWLAKFHPVALVIVPVIYAGYFFAVFPALWLADRWFGGKAFLVQAVIWVAFEYIRTLGFIGYPYGNLGYTQYLYIPLIQSAAIFGMWITSLMVVFPSVYLGNALKEGFDSVKTFFKNHRISAAVFAGLFLLNFIYGIAVQKDYSEERSWRVAMIQHHTDPWKGGDIAYKNNFKELVELTLQSMEEDPDIVVWSETSFVPGINYHSSNRENLIRYELVQELFEFSAQLGVPLLTGNDDGNRVPIGQGRYEREHYNAVVHLENGEIQDIYRKIRLVPFTENFPLKEELPAMYEWLKANDTHFWEAGTDPLVFEAAGVKFSTPICFEDVFGYLSREFVNEGAEIIVNLTNDSWSGSQEAMIQHGAMAVFRAIENRRTVVRSTNGGLTAVIDPDGRIISYLEPQIDAFLVEDVPIYTGRITPYTRFGDWFALLAVYGALLLLAGMAAYKLFHLIQAKKSSD